MPITHQTCVVLHLIFAYYYYSLLNHSLVDSIIFQVGSLEKHKKNQAKFIIIIIILLLLFLSSSVCCIINSRGYLRA
jgi:hypothetical protein